MFSLNNQCMSVLSVVFALGLMAAGLQERVFAVDKGQGTVECPACGVYVQSNVVVVEFTTGCIANDGWMFHELKLASGEESIFFSDGLKVLCDVVETLELVEEVPIYWGQEPVQVILAKGDDRLSTPEFVVEH